MKKMALIIGNGDYKSVDKLDNSTNDSSDLATKLRGFGFKVTKADNLSRRNFIKILRNFKSKLIDEKPDILLFFYSGHGLEFNNNLYLIPTDAEIGEEREIIFESIPLSFIYDDFNIVDTRQNIFILDACRDNPFQKKSRTLKSRGLNYNPHLESLKRENRSITVFPTQSGEVAYENERERNGLFTKYLLQVMDEKHSNLEDLFIRLQQVVSSSSIALGTPQKPEIIGDIGDCRYSFSPPQLRTFQSDKSVDSCSVESEINPETMIEDPVKAIPIETDKRIWVDHTSQLMWEIKDSVNINEAISYSEFEERVNELNEMKYLHFNNWRVPTEKDLKTLFEAELNSDLYIKKPLSKNSKQSYWSSTESEIRGEKIVVNFKSERSMGYRVEHSAYFRFVRSMNNSETPNYLQMDSETPIKFRNNTLIWVDLKSSLMWEVKQENNYDDKFTLSEAKRFLQKRNDTKYLGYSDWRLPLIKELKLLSKYRELFQTLPENPWYWAGDHKMDINGIPENFFVDLDVGKESFTKSSSQQYYSIMVRNCREYLCKKT
jgi:hypothetical protein